MNKCPHHVRRNHACHICATISAELVAGIERPRPTIEELERLLQSGKDMDIEIQPDGSIKAVPLGTKKDSNFKPMTFKYATAEYY